MSEECDHGTFLALYVKHQGEVRAFVRALVRNGHDAEDICQNIALVLWKKFDQYDSTRPFAAWARGVAAMEVQLIRGQSHRVPTPFSPEAVQAILDAYNRTATAHESQQRQWLEKCFRLLSQRGRQLFTLRYGLGTPVAEIAGQIQASVGSVHRALSRYRAQVRECVNRQAQQESHQAGRPAE